ncbi:TPA: Rz1-like lysis system protein LysC [Enterobacter bugandensis]|uniref:Host Lysis Related protein Prophage n=1 Tax=Enterobacter bugandensis TaxID=881260 RepID=A0A822WRX9_9ENTR|nr:MULTISPECIES: Rz1-like lysis system protein LysC [Enterobacter]MCK7089760.1 Rz1-like lysis system protein LysC [Enterobacter bugandensis]MCK7160346.1 Rz1-like lysis system protein LysC [Enterobacter bugandensis]MCK7399222.1 Rz1-like lysis system protein LysC [Enterobacter bugandensis]CZX81976.1 Host Lysis Related protein Prophage [Enterobacter bugandensis]
MLCAGCTPAPVIVYSACPKVSYCPMPTSDPATNNDLSADIRRLEHALAACALQVETVKDCQVLDEESTQPERSAD